MAKTKNEEKVKEVTLTEQEIKEIEAKRVYSENKQLFVDAYTALVKSHGFAVGVNFNSPLNNISLTVVDYKE